MTSQIEDLLAKLPPNYPVACIYLNGVYVETIAFTSLCECLAYFTNEGGQVIVLDCTKINGISFGEAISYC